MTRCKNVTGAGMAALHLPRNLLAMPVKCRRCSNELG